MPGSDRGPGRPPGPTDETYGTVLAAALELFLEGGGDALSFQRIAERAGVARTTIYRHWPDRSALVATMLEKATFSSHEDLNGDLQHDLEIVVDTLLWRFSNRPVRQFFAAVLDFGQRSAEVSETGAAYVDGLLRPLREVVDAGVARGDLVGEPSDLVAELAGPLMLRHVLLGEEIPTGEAGRLVARFLERNLQ